MKHPAAAGAGIRRGVEQASEEVAMRAIVIERFGGPDSLVYRELPEPEPLAVLP
jgi:hypothetical protein